MDNMENITQGNHMMPGSIANADADAANWAARKPDALELISQERTEQIEKHGKSIIEDDRMDIQTQPGRLRWLASALLIEGPEGTTSDETKEAVRHNILSQFQDLKLTDNMGMIVRMLDKPYKERLVIAGALIVAEIERLDYMYSKPSKEETNEPDNV